MSDEHTVSVAIAGRCGAWRERMLLNGRDQVVGTWLRHADYGLLGVYLRDGSSIDVTHLPKRAYLFVQGVIRPCAMIALEGDHLVTVASNRQQTLMVIDAHTVRLWDHESQVQPWPLTTVAPQHGRLLGSFWIAQTDTPGIEIVLPAAIKPDDHCTASIAVQRLCGISVRVENQSFLRYFWVASQIAGAWPDISYAKRPAAAATIAATGGVSDQDTPATLEAAPGGLSHG